MTNTTTSLRYTSENCLIFLRSRTIGFAPDQSAHSRTITSLAYQKAYILTPQCSESRGGGAGNHFFKRLYQHSQSGSFLSLRKMVCGVHAREIEESTITSGVERMFTRFPAYRSADEGTAENLPCELSAWKIRFL